MPEAATIIPFPSSKRQILSEAMLPWLTSTLAAQEVIAMSDEDLAKLANEFDLPAVYQTVCDFRVAERLFMQMASFCEAAALRLSYVEVA